MQKYYYYILSLLAALLLALGGDEPQFLRDGNPFPFSECMNDSLYQNESYLSGSLGSMSTPGQPGSPAPSLNMYAICALSQMNSLQSPASYSSVETGTESQNSECPFGNDSDLCGILDYLLLN